MSRNEPNRIIEDLMKEAEPLSLSDLEHLISRLSELIEERKIKRLPSDESGLMEMINNWLSADIQERLYALIAKRDSGTLTPKEQDEFTELIAQAKESHTNRVKALRELATLRDESLTALMNDLGIRFPDYV